MSQVLELKGVTKRYSGVVALRDINLAVARGDIVALVGPNGAGKTTLFDLVSGLEKPDQGRILVQGRDVTGLAAHKRPSLGLARTFQTTQSFEELDVVENILIGRCRLSKAGILASGLRTPGLYRQEHTGLVRAFEILELLGLYDKAGRRMNQISVLERKLVAIGRGLAMEPELLLLDEPFGGLGPDEAERISGILGSLAGSDLSLLIIDHRISLLQDLVDRMIVLRHGGVAAQGEPAAVMSDPGAAGTLGSVQRRAGEAR